MFYNNGEVPGDQTDFFMSPDSVSRLFAPKAMPASTLYTNVFNYSRWYRTVAAPTKHVLSDVPLTAAGGAPTGHVLAGRFPGHVEPYETPKPELVAAWGYNTTTDTAINAVGPRNLVYNENASGGTMTGTVANYPLVLTTIRCVEHFQGGPITATTGSTRRSSPSPGSRSTRPTPVLTGSSMARRSAS